MYGLRAFLRFLIFNPNADNAFLMEGDPDSANGIWLLNWREIGLEYAQKTGGWCVAHTTARARRMRNAI